MKNIVKIIVAISLTVLFSSCYKDKGNYNYTNGEYKIEISKEMRKSNQGATIDPFIFKVGQEIRIPAKYKILDKSLTKNDLSFEWYIGGKLRSTDSVLVLKKLPPFRYAGLLIIKDNKTQMRYISQVKFTVTSTYTQGWYIGSQDGNQTKISYLSLTPTDKGDIKTTNFVQDAFGLSNSTQIIGGVKNMSVRVVNMDEGNISIIQPNDDPLDINCNSMSLKSHDIKDFLTKPLSNIKDIIYAGVTVYALTESGDVYIRTESEDNAFKIIPHSSFFPSYPNTIPGGMKITKWVNTGMLATDFLLYYSIMAYDQMNNRLVVFNRDEISPLNESYFSGSTFTEEQAQHKNKVGWDGTKEYKDIRFPNPWDLKDYNLVSMNAGGSNIMDWSGTRATSYLLLLKRKSDNKLFFNAFRYTDDSYGTVDINEDLFFPVPDNIQFDENNLIIENNMGSPSQAIYFVANGGHEIYYFNLINGDIKRVYTTSSTITAIGLGEKNNYDYTKPFFIYQKKLIVATDDNKLHILKIDDNALLTGKAKELKTLDSNIGKVTHIMYMSNQIAAI